MDELRQHLLAIYNLYQVTKQYNDEIGKADNEIRYHVNEYNRLRNLRYSLKGWIFLLVFGSIALGWLVVIIGTCFNTAGSDPMTGFILHLIGTAIIFIAPWSSVLWFIFGVHRKRNRRLQVAAENYKQDVLTPIIYKNKEIMGEIQAERDAFWNANCHVLNFLPQRYHTEIAATCLLQYIRDGRAETLKEALNLYEDQLHKWEMLEHAKAIEEQNRYIALQNELMGSYLEEISDQQSRMAAAARGIDVALTFMALSD